MVKVNSVITCYWFGYGGSSWLAENLRYTIEKELGMKLVTIHEHPNANIPWNIETVYKELEKADIIIIPANYKAQPCKSNNRLTQAMALGKAVICDPMPSYIPIIKNLENGIILEEGDKSEWKFALKLLRDNKKLRDRLGKNALESSKKYSIDSMSVKWLNLLNKFKIKKKLTSIDVIIPTKNNIPILSECIKSLENSSLEEYVYIIDNDTESTKVEEMAKEMGVDYEVREL